MFVRHRLIGLVAAVAVAAAACGGGGAGEKARGGSAAEVDPELAELAMHPTADRNDQLHQAAKEKGTILVYTTLPSTEVDAQIKGFKKLYPGVKVEVYRGGSTGSMINRILTEGRAGELNADVLWTNDHITYVVNSEGYLLDYKTADHDAYDSKFRVTDNSYPSYINYWMWAYNTELITDESKLPRTYDDLLDERWSGKLSVAKYTDWFYGLWQILGDERAKKFFSGLGASDPALSDQFTPALLQVIQKERSLTLSTVSGVLAGRQRAGAPLEGYFPNEPTVARTSPMAVFAEGGNPEGGLLFAEYVLSPQGQKLLAERGRVPGNADVPPNPPELRPKQAQLINYEEFIQNEVEWERRMNEYLGGGGGS